MQSQESSGNLWGVEGTEREGEAFVLRLRR